MFHALQSELFRLRKRPQTWIMPLLASAFIGLYYGIGYLEYRTKDAVQQLETRHEVQPLSSIFENGMQVWRIVALIMIVVVASSLIGSEYGWNTLRPLVARSSSRSAMLGAKWLTVGLFTVFMVLVGVLVSLLATVVATVLMNGTPSMPAYVWDDMLLGVLRWMLAALPYAVIAFTAALLTRSNAAGIAIGIGVNFAELLLLGLLLGLLDGFETVVEFGINWNVQQLVNVTTEDGGSTLDPVSTAQVVQSALILTLYCAIAIALTYRVFMRRDITSG